MANLRLVPLTVKVPSVLNAVMAQAKINVELVSFGGEMVRTMADYPEARPWKSRPPRTGPRAGGRRTGQLGRNWKTRHGPSFIEVFNDVGYPGYVEGYAKGAKGQRQTRVMRARGWQRIDEEGRRVWSKYVRRIQKAARG
jgi:hypothetical protein